MGGKTAKNTKKPEKRSGTVWLAYCSNIQDFVQEVPVGQIGSGYPLSVPAVAHPPPRYQGVGGEKGEVEPPKCPTRQSGLADSKRIDLTKKCKPFMPRLEYVDWSCEQFLK